MQKLLKNWEERFHQLSVRVAFEGRAFPSAFFSFFCLPFFLSLSLSLVCCFVTLRHHHKNTHPQKSHQTQFSLFLSLFRRRRRRRRGRTRWSSVRVVSDLRFFPLVLVVGRVQKKGEGERIVILLIFGVAFPGKRLQRQYHHRFHHHHQREEVKEEEA